MTATEETLDVCGLRLAARVWGPADAPRVLALHGWMDNAATFDALAPLLPGLRIVALDLPGHGRSEHRGPGSYYFLDYVADALAAADALGWERFSLLGHSLGAGVSVLAAGAAPARLERLVLLEGMGPLTERDEAAPDVLARALAAEARRRGRGRRPPLLESIDEAARLRLAASPLTEAAARTLVARSLQEVEGGLTWRTDPRLRQPSRARLTEAQTLAFLRAVACPTMIVRARDGFSFDPEITRARVAALRRAQVVEVPGRHHAHLDDPAPVAALVGPFLRGDREAS